MSDELAKAAEKIKHFVGIPLSHRFQPTEKSRAVPEADGNNLASEIGFDPVASIKLPDQKLYLRPVNNTQTRYIKPVALNGSAVLPVRGERVFEFSEAFQNQLGSKVEAVARPLSQPEPSVGYLGYSAPSFKQRMPTSADKTKLLADLTKTTQIARNFLNKQNLPSNTLTPAPPVKPTIQAPPPTIVAKTAVTVPIEPKKVLEQKPTLPQAVVQTETVKTKVEKPSSLEQKPALSPNETLAKLPFLAEKLIEEEKLVLPKPSYNPINLPVPAPAKPEIEFSQAISKLATTTSEEVKTPTVPAPDLTNVKINNEEGQSAELKVVKTTESTDQNIKPQISIPAQAEVQPLSTELIASQVEKIVEEQKDKIEETVKAELEKKTQESLVLPSEKVVETRPPTIATPEENNVAPQTILPQRIGEAVLPLKETPETPPTARPGLTAEQVKAIVEAAQGSDQGTPTNITSPVIIQTNLPTKPKEPPKEPVDPKVLEHMPDRKEIQKNIVIAEGKINSLSKESLSEGEHDKFTDQLKTLEHQADIMVHYDGLQYQGEKQRILQEIQVVVEEIDKKIKSHLTAEQKEALTEEERRKVNLSQKEKVAEEVRVLVEKEKAKKARSRNVVAAQPAFGKMIPPKVSFPNVINGIVRDNKGLLLSGVVMIIKDHAGEPVRALKSNKIGQFVISTPLPNGTYEVELEKDGLEFDVVRIEVKGEVMKPIEIKAL